MTKKRILMCNEASYLSTGFATYGHEILTRLHATGKYEIAELASYGDTSDPVDRRCDGVPWKFYPVLPNQQDQDEVNKYNSKPTNQFGEWKFEQTCLDFRPDCTVDIRDFWMCLTAGTPILCESGVKNVEDIKFGDRVLTHTGDYRSVNHVFPERKHSGLFVTLTPKCCRIPIKLTSGHPVLSIKHTIGQNLPDFDSNTPEWVNSENLKSGDIVCFPKTSSRSGGVLPDKARLLGYYAAEGCMMYEGKKSRDILKGVQFVLGLDEWRIVHDIIDLVRNIYGCQVYVHKASKSNAVILRLFSSSVAKDIKYHVAGLATNKNISPELFFSSNESTTQFLCGLFRGDGHISITKKLRASYCTSSRSLAIQVFQLCVRHGVLPSFFKQNNPLNGKMFTRYLFGFNAEALIGFTKFWNGIPQDDSTQSNRIDNKFAYLTLSKVEHSYEDEPVYNFEVAQHNSYVSSMCLHNCEHEERSPFRKYYHMTLMPTVDAEPQDDAWISTYMNADGVFTYSDWGLEVLNKQGGGRVKTICSAPPGADSDILVPVPDKRAHKRQMGLPDDCLIVGTIMRNQERKLYPALIASFAKFLRKGPVELTRRCYLYLHVCYPDLGWDIPRLLKDAGIGGRTLFTYSCNNCGVAFPSFFMDAKAFCRKCGQQRAMLPSSSKGVARNVLGNVLNFMDVYVQYASSEGFGLPQTEAASCAVPVMSVDYSAMSDVVRKLKGIPIQVLTLVREASTGCNRAVPDNDDFIAKLTSLLSMPDSLRLKMGRDGREACLEHYSYERTAKIWENYFDSVSCRPHSETWLSPPRIFKPNLNLPQGLADEEFVRWGICNLAGRPDLVNSYMALRMTRDLTWQASLGNVPKSVFNEMAFLGVNYCPVDYFRFKEPGVRYNHGTRFVVDELLEMSEKSNYWERRRADAQKTGVPH